MAYDEEFGHESTEHENTDGDSAQSQTAQSETAQTANPQSENPQSESPHSENPPIDAPHDDVPAEPAPEPAKRARRSRKTAVAADEAPDAGAESAESAAHAGHDAGEVPGDAESAPAKAAKKAPRTRAARTSTSRKKVVTDPLIEEAPADGPDDAPYTVAASPADEPDPDVLDPAELARLSEALDVPVVAMVLDEDDFSDWPAGAAFDSDAQIDQAAGSTTGEPGPAPLATPFGVLFQPPDTSVVRHRRRATAPQAAPPPPAAGDHARDLDDVDAAGSEDLDGDDELDTDLELAGQGFDGQQFDGSDEDGDGDGDGEAESDGRRTRRRRGGKGRRGRADRGRTTTGGGPVADALADESSAGAGPDDSDNGTGGDLADDDPSGTRRRRRRRRAGSGADVGDDTPGVVTRVREARRSDEVTGVRGSTRLEAKKQRRREGREAGRRRTVITEAEFLARRESVERVMVVRTKNERTQIGVVEDGVLVEHYIDRATTSSLVGNIYLGRVQNVLPSMEAAFVDIGKGRNAVLYAGEVNWDRAGLESGETRRIENALTPGQPVLVQVTKDPIGHKGARLTSQISLPGRYLVYVPDSSMTGISRKLPDTERARLKRILREVVPASAGVIVRTAAEGAAEEDLRADVERLTRTWAEIQATAEEAGNPGRAKGRRRGRATGPQPTGNAPVLVHGEADMTVRVIRDIFNEDFTQVVVAGDEVYEEVRAYVGSVAPDLSERVVKWVGTEDLFTHHRIDEQLAKALDRKVWLPSGGSLVIDRTEAMTVVDVNTGKFVGSGGNLEETVTKNNIEAAEEIVRQLRLRDIGGIIVVDFIDMVLESNRDLVVRRLLECLGRDRTKHQVAEVTSLGLVQMTRKRVGSGLLEVFSEQCDHCNGRGIIVHSDPVERTSGDDSTGGFDASNRSSARSSGNGARSGSTQGAASTPAANRRRGRSEGSAPAAVAVPAAPRTPSGPTLAQIAAAAHAAALKSQDQGPVDESAQAERVQDERVQDEPVDIVREIDADDQLAPTEPTEPDQPGEPDQSETGERHAGEPDAGDPDAGEPGDGHTGPDVDLFEELRHWQAVTETPADQPEDAQEAAEALSSLAETLMGPSGDPEPRPRRRRGRASAPAGPPTGGTG